MATNPSPAAASSTSALPMCLFLMPCRLPAIPPHNQPHQVSAALTLGRFKSEVPILESRNPHCKSYVASDGKPCMCETLSERASQANTSGRVEWY
jgi:hypothetical protein